MKNSIHRTALLSALVASSLLAASCKDPAAPALGAQIDRMGRAGVNTALTDPFNLNSTSKGGVQDGYNAAAVPSQWGGTFTSRIASNLAILDSLDTVCGNQLLAGPAPVAGRYNTLATVLADDQLYVNSSSGTCNVYLAVEANAVGIANTDCGGRTPLVDTIDRTYSVLAIGALSGVTDGVASDADGGHSASMFPFLKRPN
ncbi:MAG: hypothetical protein ABIR28_02020 [Vicinamibacteria bacterium]